MDPGLLCVCVCVCVCACVRVLCSGEFGIRRADTPLHFMPIFTVLDLTFESIGEAKLCNLLPHI